MTCEPERLEAKTAWTEIQLDIARKAVFEDTNLSFEVRSALSSSHILVKQQDSNAVDLDPHVATVHHSQGTIHGLTAVAGLDISFFKDDPDNAIAALTVLSFPDMRVLHSITRRIHLDAPYIPSFLAMREADHFVALIDELREYTKKSKSIPFPQIFLVDGNGRLHERQAGLATVVGVKAGVPTIGCAKDYHPTQAMTHDLPSYLKTQKGFKVACKDILHNRGDWLEIYGSSHKQAFGAALLSSPHRNATVPIFVSPGHCVSLESAVAITLACCQVGRVPEPVRQADQISRNIVMKMSKAPQRCLD